MATYEELHELANDSTLLGRISVAVAVAAVAISTEDGATANHANRLLWAKEALISPKATARSIYPAILADNAAASVAQITGADDTTLLNGVNDIIDLFATGV